MEHVETEAIKTIYQWIIPGVGLFVWAGLAWVIVSAVVRRLQKGEHEIRRVSGGIMGSILKIPLILVLIGVGVAVFFDATPALPKKWVKYQDASLLILFVFAIYLFLDKLMVEVLKRYGKTTTVITAGTGVIKILYRVTLLGFIFLVILDQLKITISPLLASLGIMGLVVSLALQDTLANFFAGISLSIDRPVRIGDYIKLESGEGYVTQIGWRSTRIRTLSNKNLIVPNSKVTGSAITNFYLPELEWSASVNVGVSYGSDLEKVERITVEVAQEVLREVEGGVKEFQPSIRYNAFGDSGIKFSVDLRVRTYVDQYLIIHEFIKRLYRRYQSEGIEIPFPSRTIYLKDGTGRRTEIEKEK